MKGKLLLGSFLLILSLIIYELVFIIFLKNNFPSSQKSFIYSSEGKTAPTGTIIYDQQKMYTYLTGTITDVQNQNGKVYLELSTFNSSKHEIKQPILVFDTKDNIPFFLNIQNSLDLFPVSKNIKTHSYSNVEKLVDALNQLKEFPTLITIRLKGNSPPQNSNMLLMHVNQVLKKYLPCNNLYINSLKSSKDTVINCMPYSYQVSVYEQ